MDKIEREYRRTRRARRQRSTAVQRQQHAVSPTPEAIAAKRAAIRKATGLDIRVCIGCGSTNILSFQLDHIAGRKHDDVVWPLCTSCHERKTDMLYEEPSVSGDPRNPLQIIGRWLQSIAQYIDVAIEFLKLLGDKCREFADFLIGQANLGLGDGLVIPAL